MENLQTIDSHGCKPIARVLRGVIKTTLSARNGRRGLLLQVRVQALNDDLRSTFARWYPDFRRRQEEKLAA
jgi:hypothetical protein